MGDALTDEGHAEVETIARRHDLPADAVAALLAAIRRGSGRQAQFSHPALGGMGQWTQGGGIMIGDMFNHSLKSKVEQLCNELADHVGDERFFAHEPTGSSIDWWPQDLGRSSAAGSQNELSYACFPESRRLAIRNADGVRLYDTGDHRISGVSQQQGTSCDLAFTSQLGSVRLHELARIDGEPAHGGSDATQRQTGKGADERSGTEERSIQQSRGVSDDVLATLERLHELQRKGVLTEAEFGDKKAELLARL